MYADLTGNCKKQRIKSHCDNNVSLANSFRTLRAYLAEITRQIGVGLGAAIRHAVVGLNTLMKYVLKASQAFANFMQKIFGKYEGGASFVDMDMSGMSDDMGDFADGADSAADGLDDASDAAEKLKKDLSVLPFDELNQLNKDKEKTTTTSGKGADVGGDIGGLGDTDKYGEGMFANSIRESERELTDFEKYLKDWHDKCAESLNAKDWEGLGANVANGLNDGVKTLYDALNPDKVGEKINPWLDAFSTTVNSLVDKFNWEQMGGLIGEGITILVNALNRILDPKTGIDFENLGKKLGGMFMGMIRDINWTGVGNLISNKFMSGWRIFKGFVDELKADEIGIAIHDAIGGALENLELGTIGEALGSFITKCAQAIAIGFGDIEHWKDLGSQICDGLQKFFESISGSDLADALNALLDGLFAALDVIAKDKEWQEEAKEDVVEFIKGLHWDNIGKLVAPFVAVKLIGGLWNPFKTKIWALVLGKLSTFWKGFTAPNFVPNLVSTLATYNPAMLSVSVASIWDSIEKKLKETALGRKILGLDEAIFREFQELVANVSEKFGKAVEEFIEDFLDLFSFENTKKKWDNVKEDFKKGGLWAILGIGEGFQAAFSFLTEPIETLIAKILGFFEEKLGISSPAENTKYIGTNIMLGIRDGMLNKVSAITKVISDLPGNIAEAAGDAKKWLYSKGQDAITGLRDGWDSVKESKMYSELSAFKENAKTKLGDISNKVKTKGADLIEGLRNGWDSVKESKMYDTLADFKNVAYNKIGDVSSKVKSRGKEIITGMKSGLTDNMDDLKTYLGKIPDKIKKSIGSLYSLGKEMIGDFVDGLSSMTKFPSPHIDWDWGGRTLRIGNWEYTLPKFYINWYKRGGLFTDATIAGFGEAGNEAALPLENKRTMKMIANAIIDGAGGSFGMDENAMANAVAKGYVQAMMANQGNERPIDVYATLYTENNEVLARAVQRGQRSIDYRNNPSPAVNY